jgi:hypothetical protein
MDARYGREIPAKQAALTHLIEGGDPGLSLKRRKARTGSGRTDDVVAAIDLVRWELSLLLGFRR